MLVGFLAKRVAVLAAMAAAAAFILDGFSPLAPLGIVLGGFLGVYKTRLNSLLVTNAASGGAPAKTAALQLLAQMMVLALLVATALTSLHLFAGAAIGLSLLPIFICINAATEKFGLTHNAWGEAQHGPARR